MPTGGRAGSDLRDPHPDLRVVGLLDHASIAVDLEEVIYFIVFP